MFTEWESEARKSMSNRVSPPLPLVTVSLPAPALVRTCTCLTRAGPTPREPVPVTRLLETSELDIGYSFGLVALIFGAAFFLGVPSGFNPRAASSSALGFLNLSLISHLIKQMQLRQYLHESSWNHRKIRGCQYHYLLFQKP